MCTVFHGSFIEIKTPLVNVGRKELDFGPGFYVTTIRSQAERWARRVCIIRRKLTPVLNVYDFDLESCLAQGFERKLLPKYNKEWLDFIVKSRMGLKPWEGYDIVQGGVANDQVIDTVEDYYADRITAAQALGQLKFAKPSNQICINNQVIVDKYVKFVRSENL